jgi:hypothetical protein
MDQRDEIDPPPDEPGPEGPHEPGVVADTGEPSGTADPAAAGVFDTDPNTRPAALPDDLPEPPAGAEN